MSFQGPKIFEKTYVVTDTEAIHFLGPEVTPGLSTPSLVTWMELTSRENAASLLNAGEDGVGTHVRILVKAERGQKEFGQFQSQVTVS